MLHIEVPCHPLSKRVLISEYGNEPIVMNNHDPLFYLLTCAPLRTRRTVGIFDQLSTTVTFLVNERLAFHIKKYDWQIGFALLKHHKRELCQFTASAVTLGFKGGARGALYFWLQDKRVAEDEYSLETAYKLWQRFGWKICDGKNTTFFGHLSGKAGAFLAEKKRSVPKPGKPIQWQKMTLSEIEIELAAMRFAKAVSQCFTRQPKKLAGHARIYYYTRYAQMSERCLSRRLDIPRTSIQHAVRTIQLKCEKNITLRHMIYEALPPEALAKAGLPEVTGRRSPLGHDS